MININISRNFLRSFYNSSTITRARAESIATRFLRLDLPRACFVHEVTQTTIDVPLWKLICQLTLLDTSGTAPSSTKGRHWLTEITYHSLLVRVPCHIDYHTCANLSWERACSANTSHEKKRFNCRYIKIFCFFTVARNTIIDIKKRNFFFP